MRDIVNSYVRKFKEERLKRRKAMGVLLALALLVTAGVSWQLHFTGIALTNETYCGLEEHQHSEACYEKVLVCGLEESGEAAESTAETAESEAAEDSSEAAEASTETAASEPAEESDEATEASTEASESGSAEESAETTGEAALAASEITAGHIHTDDCYETQEALVCGQEESEGHTHTTDCYDGEGNLTCTLEESEGHTHTSDCYEEQEVLICGLEETEDVSETSEGHTHTDSCYDEDGELVCGLEETEDVSETSTGHTHTEACYEYQLVCGLEEHTHTVACLSDETADVETAYDWASTLPDMTGVLADDVVAVAESQLGYTESTRNFVLADDGETRKGYTRYGAWYGDGFEYVDWDAMFASFCLYYAGIDESAFSLNSGAYAWAAELESLGYYVEAADAEPLAGDLVFFDTDGDGRADRVGIVTAITENTESTDGEETANGSENDAEGVSSEESASGAETGAVAVQLTVVEGDYTNEEGTDTTAENTYSIDDSTILGYGALPVEEEENANGGIMLAEEEQGANNGIVLAASNDEIQWTETTYTSYTERKGTKTYTSEGENNGDKIALDVTYYIYSVDNNSNLYSQNYGYIQINLFEDNITSDTYYFNIDIPTYCVVTGKTGNITYNGYTIGTYVMDSSGCITLVFNSNADLVFDVKFGYLIANININLISKKQDEVPTADNNYTAAYTLIVNGGGGDASGEESLLITDTMENLAYIKGSLTIVNSTYTSDELVLVDAKPSADEDGKTFYSVSWDGVETSGTVSGTLTITIWYPYKDSTYTISYNAQVFDSGFYKNMASASDLGSCKYYYGTSDQLIAAMGTWYKASVIIKKMDETETVALKDAEYGLYNAATGGLVASGKTDGDGMLTFAYNAAEGIIYSFNTQFYLQEITAPDGYELDTTKYYFYFVKEGTMPSATLKGTKIVVDSSSNLTYYDESGTEIMEGYITLTDTPKTYTMPETGGAGTYGFFLAGAALCGGAGLMLYRRRRKLSV